MALQVKDCVAETSTTVGTGAFALAAAITGYRRFSSVCSVSDTAYYVAYGVDANGNRSGEWECGLGTYSGTNTLTRTSVHASSNSNNAVSFSAGTKYVLLDATATYLAALGLTFSTAAEIRAGTEAGKAIAPDQLQVAVAPQTLTDAATVSWNMATAINAKVTLGGNRTLSVSNPVAGQTYSLGIIQDATGGRTVTWPGSFDWGAAGAPTLSTIASKRDRVTVFCTDAATPKFDAFLSGRGFS